MSRMTNMPVTTMVRTSCVRIGTSGLSSSVRIIAMITAATICITSLGPVYFHMLRLMRNAIKLTK